MIAEEPRGVSIGVYHSKRRVRDFGIFRDFLGIFRGATPQIFGIFEDIQRF